MQRKGIQKNVWVFGLTAFLNDIASGAIKPLTPIFLVNYLGATPAIMGIIEGIAKGTVNLSKPLFGYLSDRLRKRKIFVEFGYAISVIGRFLIALSLSWPMFLLGRFVDRLGKGMRVPARDAMISKSSTRKSRGEAFGIHRALGRSGEVIGPFVSFLLLPYIAKLTGTIKGIVHYFNSLNVLFVLVVLPMVIGVPIIHYYISESKFGKSRRFSGLTPRFKKFVLVMALFNLANFPLAFIFLKANETGVNIGGSLLIYTLFNIIYVAFVYTGGVIVDRIGGKSTLAASFLVLSIASLMLAFSRSIWDLMLAIVAFSIFYSLYVVSNRAFTSLISKQERLGTSYGVLDMSVGIANLVSGLAMGFLWTAVGSIFAFLLVSVIAVASGILLWVWIK